MDRAYRRAINERYARPDLETYQAFLTNAILSGLRQAGKDLNALTSKDLAPVDQFHTGGEPATLELARLAQLREGMHVLVPLWRR